HQADNLQIPRTVWRGDDLRAKSFDFPLDLQGVHEFLAQYFGGRNRNSGLRQPECPEAQPTDKHDRGAGNNFVARFPGQNSAHHDCAPDAVSGAAFLRMMSPSCRPERTTTSVSL